MPLEENKVADSVTAQEDSVTSTLPEEKKETTAATIKQLVTQWNLAHNKKDYSALAKMYADEVNLYGTVFENAEAVAHKKQFFTEKTQTYQQILGEADVVIHSPFVAKASFIKKVTTGKTAKNYDAYLMFEKVNNDWKIVAESDELADNQTAQSRSAEIKIADITNCEKAAEAVFRSSKTVQQLLKTANTNFKLEYKPGDKNNPNKRFWYWVYANAPNG
ncbi:MAG: hypothetical protein EOP53_04165, partial [Sphingobacteriales bacterium]